MATAQSQPGLLNLPMELRLMILERVLKNLHYRHSADVPQERVWANFKRRVGIIWVNQQLRYEALGILQENRTLHWGYEMNLLTKMPQLILNNTTRLIDHDWCCSDPVWYKAELPLICSVIYYPETTLDPASCKKLNDNMEMVTALRGKHDAACLTDAMSWRHRDFSDDGRRSSPIPIMNAFVDFEDDGEGKRRTPLSLYLLEIDMKHATILDRYINMSEGSAFWEKHQKQAMWPRAEETCLMVDVVSWPTVYHPASGNRRVLTPDAGLVLMVNQELEDEETLRRALEAAHLLTVEEQSADG